MSGLIRNENLPGLLQNVSSERYTGVFTIFSAVDSGQVYFQKGDIVAVNTPLLHGNAALARLLTLREARYQFWETEIEVLPNVKGRTHDLLMDALVYLENAANGIKPMAKPSPEPQPKPQSKPSPSSNVHLVGHTLEDILDTVLPTAAPNPPLTVEPLPPLPQPPAAAPAFGVLLPSKALEDLRDLVILEIGPAGRIMLAVTARDLGLEVVDGLPQVPISQQVAFLTALTADLQLPDVQRVAFEAKVTQLLVEYL